MDPDAALEDARQAARRWRTFADDDLAGNDDEHDAAYDLIEAFDTLDRWLSGGGFLPAAWRHTVA